MVVTLEMLPLFGAAKVDSDGYLMIPDGAGAIVTFKPSTPSTASATPPRLRADAGPQAFSGRPARAAHSATTGPGCPSGASRMVTPPTPGSSPRGSTRPTSTATWPATSPTPTGPRPSSSTAARPPSPPADALRQPHRGRPDPRRAPAALRHAPQGGRFVRRDGQGLPRLSDEVAPAQGSPISPPVPWSTSTWGPCGLRLPGRLHPHDHLPPGAGHRPAAAGQGGEGLRRAAHRLERRRGAGLLAPALPGRERAGGQRRPARLHRLRAQERGQGLPGRQLPSTATPSPRGASSVRSPSCATSGPPGATASTPASTPCGGSTSCPSSRGRDEQPQRRLLPHQPHHRHQQLPQPGLPHAQGDGDRWGAVRHHG